MATPADYSVTTTSTTITVTANTSNADTFSISEPSSGNIQFAAAGRYFSVNGGTQISGNSGSISLTGITSVTFTANNSGETINVGAFSYNNLPSMTFTGGTGNDTFNFNGNLTYTANATLTINMSSGTDEINIASGVTILLSGNSTMSLACSDTITIGSNANLYASQITLQSASVSIDPTASVGSHTAVTGNPSTATIFASGLNSPRRLTMDAAGNIYVSQNGAGTITKYTPAGASSTYASGLSGPIGMKFDGQGNMFVCNNATSGSYANSVVKITPGGSISTFAGGFSGTDDLDTDNYGNFYVSGFTGQNVTKLSPTGTNLGVFVSGLSSPAGVKFDTAGYLYIANEGNATITKVTSTGSTSTFASGSPLATPSFMDFDSAGNLYVANVNGSTISKITPGGAVSTYASNINTPRGPTFDEVGDLFVVDTNDGRIYKIEASTPATTQVTFLPASTGGAITVGNSVAGSLSLTSTELNRVFVASTGYIQLGNASSGAITQTQSLAISSANAPRVISLVTGSSISMNSGGGYSVNLVQDLPGTPLSESDRITTTGPVTLTGGSLTVSTSLTATNFVAGDTWQIFSWGTAPTGTFSYINLPQLASGLGWDTSALYTSGTISVIKPTLVVQQPVGTTLVSNSGTDFGTVSQGNSVSVTYTLKNTGAATLTLSGENISSTTGNTGDFVITTSPSSSISANGSTTLVVTYTPSTSSDETAILTFNSSDSTTPTFIINLSGTAPSSSPLLSALSFSGGALSPTFSSSTLPYTAPDVSYETTGVTVTPTTTYLTSTISVQVNGGGYNTVVASGSSSGILPTQVGSNEIDVKVTDSGTSQVYSITFTRDTPSVAVGITQNWFQIYTGAQPSPVNGDALAVAIQKSGNDAVGVFTTGYTTNASGRHDIYTASYNVSTGAQLWAVDYPSPGSGNAQGSAIAVDSSGNVIIAGTVTTSAGASAAYVAKYNGTNGNKVWDHTYTSPGNNGPASAVSVAVDAAGNVAVAGSAYNTTTSQDFYVAKLDTNGNVIFEVTYDGGYNKADYASAVAIDASGNVMAAGALHNASNIKDCWVLKLNGTAGGSAGTILWNFARNGTEQSGLYKDNEVYSMTLDSQGNPLLAGDLVDTAYDLYAAKLNGSTGAVVWENIYNPYGNDSVYYKVTVDANDNAILGGTSRGSTAALERYVAKLSGTDGTRVWDARLNTGTSNTGRIYGVAVDLAGNVAVTGNSLKSNGSPYDIYTAKLLAATGAVMWEEHYPGDGTSGGQGNGIAMTGNGDVFVAGYDTSTSGTTNYVVLNYQPETPSSQATQTITFNNPGAQGAGVPLVLSATASSGLGVTYTVISGPATLGGTDSNTLTFTGAGTVTVQADQSGDSTYSPALSVQQTFSVALSSQTISFSLPATVSQLNTLPLSGVASSGLSVSYSITSGPGSISNGVLSFTGTGQVTIQATQAGNTLFSAATPVSVTLTASYAPPVVIPETIYQNWTQNGPGGANGQGVSVALQPSGGAALTGYTTTSTGQSLYTAVYNSSGSQVWQVTYNGAGSGSGNNMGKAVKVDTNGDVYICGYTAVAATTTAAYVAKYSGTTGGTPLWSQTFTGTANTTNSANCMTLDTSSNSVIVGGYLTNTSTGQDYFVAKINCSTGVVTWSQTYNGSPNLNDVIYAVAVDSGGNIAVTGDSQNVSINQYNYNEAWTLKLDSNGNQLWSQRYHGVDKLDDHASAIAFDGNADVMISGYVKEAVYDIFVGKYSGVTGAVVWATEYNPAGVGTDAAYDMKVDPNGNAIIAGAITTSVGISTAYTAQFSGQSGSLVWSTPYTGTASLNCRMTSLSLDPAGWPVVAGYATNANNSTSIYTAKYQNSNGNLVWSQTYQNTASTSCTPAQVATDGSGNVWVTGYLTDTSNYTEPLLINYTVNQPVNTPNVVSQPQVAMASFSAAPSVSPASSTLAVSQTLSLQQGDTVSVPAECYYAGGDNQLTYSATVDGVSVGGVAMNNASNTLTWTYNTAALSGGTHTAVISVTDPNGNSSSMAVSLQVSGLNPLPLWRKLNFGSTLNTGAASNAAMPFKDGITNLEKFAFGMNANAPTAANNPKMPSISTDGNGNRQARFSRLSNYANSGVSYTVMFSSDLLNWTPSTVEPTILSDNGTVQTVSVPYPSLPQGATGQFFKVQLQSNE